MLHTRFVLFSLDLVGVQVINLLSKLSHGIIVLLSQSSKSSFMGNVHFFQFSLEPSKFSFSLLVEFNLSGRVGTFYGQFFIQLFKASLEFFDLLAIFASKSGFILNLGSNGSRFLFFALGRLIELILDTFKI